MSTTSRRLNYLTGFCVFFVFAPGFLAAQPEDGDTIRRRAQAVLAKGRYQNSLHFDDASDRTSLEGAPSAPSARRTTFNPSSVELRPLTGVATALLYVILGVVVVLAVIWIISAVREKSLASAGNARQGQVRRVVAGTSQSGPSVQRSENHLQKADLLAASGKFDEAARLLLIGAIQFLSRTSSSARKNSFTSRELLKQVQLDGHRHNAFRDIVLAVEQSVFAGRPATKAAYELCRRHLQTLRSKDPV